MKKNPRFYCKLKYKFKPNHHSMQSSGSLSNNILWMPDTDNKDSSFQSHCVLFIFVLWSLHACYCSRQRSVIFVWLDSQCVCFSQVSYETGIKYPSQNRVSYQDGPRSPALLWTSWDSFCSAFSFFLNSHSSCSNFSYKASDVSKSISIYKAEQKTQNSLHDLL